MNNLFICLFCHSRPAGEVDPREKIGYIPTPIFSNAFGISNKVRRSRFAFIYLDFPNVVAEIGVGINKLTVEAP